MMSKAYYRTVLRILAVALTVAWLAACSVAPHRHEPLEDVGITERALEKQTDSYRVRASAPGEEETERLFGAPLYDYGVQPVWLEVSNLGEHRSRLTYAGIDPRYFSPIEVAYMNRKRLSSEGLGDLERYLYENALPRQIPPNSTVSGFVFTNLERGTKSFNVDLISTDGSNEFEQFTFFLQVPGFVPDHASVDFPALYEPDEISEVDMDGLRALLDNVPCCTVDRAGERRGRPVNLFLIAEGRDLLRALLRAGWSETSYVRDETYLDSAEHYFGRVPDAVFRKGRDWTTERLEFSLWLAPARVSGTPLWVGQVRHAIGRWFSLGERFFGTNLDPDATEGRNYILQDLWYGQSLSHWAWSDSGIDVPMSSPGTDFLGRPWFTQDSFRLALWISERPISLSQTTRIEWDEPMATRGGQP